MDHIVQTASDEALQLWKEAIEQIILTKKAGWDINHLSLKFEASMSKIETELATKRHARSTVEMETAKLSRYGDGSVVGGRFDPNTSRDETEHREKLVTAYTIYHHQADKLAIANLMAEHQRPDLGAAALWTNVVARLPSRILKNLLSVKARAIVISIMRSEEWAALSTEDRKSKAVRMGFWARFVTKQNIAWFYYDFQHDVDIFLILDSGTDNFAGHPGQQIGLQQIIKNKMIWSCELMFTHMDVKVDPRVGISASSFGDIRMVYAQWGALKIQDVISRFDSLVRFEDIPITNKPEPVNVVD